MADAPPALVATLIAHPAEPCLGADLVARAEAAAGRVSRDRMSATRILATGVAVELRLEGDAAGSREVEARLRDALGGAPVDVVVQPDEVRRKCLLLADMDSTMIEQECIDELADFVGLKGQVAAITERAMRGEVAFAPALRQRVKLLAGLSADVVARIVAERLTLTPGARTLVATMRAAGARTCLVSGGFTAFTAPVAALIGFEEDRANRLVVKGGSLTGEVEEPILGREAKRATLIELREALGLHRADVLAAGDGANDLDMLGEAGLGVAFRAKPAVAAAAHARIEHGDLTALLYLQGYARDEFVMD